MRYVLRLIALAATFAFVRAAGLDAPASPSGWALSLALAGGFALAAFAVAERWHDRLSHRMR